MDGEIEREKEGGGGFGEGESCFSPLVFLGESSLALDNESPSGVIT